MDSFNCIILEWKLTNKADKSLLVISIFNTNIDLFEVNLHLGLKRNSIKYDFFRHNFLHKNGLIILGTKV